MTSHNLDTPFGSINLYLQSKDAEISTGTNNSHKTWYLNTPISAPRPDVKMLASVTDFQMAYSWYLIRTGVNDQFAFSDTAGAASKTTVTIPQGNYNATTFKNKLNELIKAALGIGVDTMTYDKSTNKYTYTSPTGSNNVVIYNKDNGTLCDTEVGIEASDNQAGTGSVVFPNMVDFGGIPYVYIVTPTLGLENRNSKGDINLTLAKVPVTCQPLGFLYMPTGSFVYLHLSDREIKKLTIILEDEEGNELDLNGVGWGLTITIHYQYQRFPKNPSLTLQHPYLQKHEEEPKKENGKK